MDEIIKDLQAIRSGQVDQFKGAMLSGATLTVPKIGAGFLHAITVGSESSPTLTIYDAASGSSGTILAQINANQPAKTYILDIPFTYGLSAYSQLAAGPQPVTTLSYK
ncbi:MAG: hypothetical protein M0P59_13380 [Gallionella sp.]|jgi:hypothetical protein|nr:hypothetical protein [Gallionella sp.]